MARGFLLVLATVAALTVAPSVAAADLRYAAPNGSELTGCGKDEPCSLGRALANAGPNDEVIVTTGDYGSVAAPLPNPAVGAQPGLDVHGEDGQPRPRIFGFTAADTSVLDVTGAGAKVRHLEIHQLSGGSRQGAFVFDGAEANDLIVVNAANQGKACILLGTSVLRDSVCEATASDGVAVSSWRTQGDPGANNSTIRNVTAIAPGSGGTGIQALAGNGAADDHHFDITNTIARGGHADVAADNLPAGAMGTATITIDHSNFGFESQLPVGSGTGRIVDGPGGGNQRFMPVAFAGAEDFHQAAASITIDQGADDPLNGATDFDGDPRTLGQGGTDIGADEFVPPPTAVTGDPGAATTSTAVVNGTVNPNTVATTYHFEYGTTTDYGTSTAETSAGAGSADVQAAETLSDLAAGTVYHYRVVAASAGGITAGADRTLSTTSPDDGGGGGAGGGGGGAQFLSALKLKPATFAAARRGGSVLQTARKRRPIGTTVTFRLSEAGAVRFRVERARPGRRAGRTRYKLLKGSFTVNAKAGQTRFHFSGRLRKHKLAVARYRLVARTTGGVPKRARFRIVRNRQRRA